MEAAERSNPKLEAYIQDIKSARGEEELSRSAYHPSINLEVGPNYTDRGGKGSQWTYSFDVMGTVRWNIFNSGADVAETKAARARVRQARQTMYSFVDDLKLEIETTWTQYLSARSNSALYRRHRVQHRHPRRLRRTIHARPAQSVGCTGRRKRTVQLVHPGRYGPGNILVAPIGSRLWPACCCPIWASTPRFWSKAPSVDPADPREAW